MKDKVIRRRAQIASGEIDLDGDNLETRTIFNLIMKAGEDEEGKYSLDDEEVVSFNCSLLRDRDQVLISDWQCLRHVICWTRYVFSTTRLRLFNTL